MAKAAQGEDTSAKLAAEQTKCKMFDPDTEFTATN